MKILFGGGTALEMATGKKWLRGGGKKAGQKIVQLFSLPKLWTLLASRLIAIDGEFRTIFGT